MKILNAFSGDEIKQAAFQFTYNGYTISTSNMFGRYEILVWGEHLKQRADSIKHAIELVDKVNTNVKTEG